MTSEFEEQLLGASIANAIKAVDNDRTLNSSVNRPKFQNLSNGEVKSPFTRKVSTLHSRVIVMHYHYEQLAQPNQVLVRVSDFSTNSYHKLLLSDPL